MKFLSDLDEKFFQHVERHIHHYRYVLEIYYVLVTMMTTFTTGWLCGRFL